MAKKFLSGNEAFAYGVRLARPQVISAYPITPQTIRAVTTISTRNAIDTFLENMTLISPSGKGLLPVFPRQKHLPA